MLIVSAAMPLKPMFFAERPEPARSRTLWRSPHAEFGGYSRRRNRIRYGASSETFALTEVARVLALQTPRDGASCLLIMGSRVRVPPRSPCKAMDLLYKFDFDSF